MSDTPAVLELRQYTLHPGRREALIELFDREFVEGQEAAGIRVLGQFRDLGRPDHFVWLRGFPDMHSRAESLEAFYGGPVWRAHREAANATMKNSDDVLLLRPIPAGSGFTLAHARPPVGARQRLTSLVVATIYSLNTSAEDFARFFVSRVRPVLVETGAPPLAAYATEPAPNTFPRLPVRTGENVFVSFTSFAGLADYERHRARLADSRAWTAAVLPELRTRLTSTPQELRLEPTARSLLRHASPAIVRPMGSRHDFDFIAGSWKVHNRRLVRRGVGADEWDEFPATSRGALHLGGIVNVDEIVFPTKGWSGMSVRVFNLGSHQWSIYWIDSRTGTLFPPVVGGFDGDQGLFFGDDEDEGRAVKVRFTWTTQGPDAARWEQAFSYDAKAWETNWVMDFRRE